METLSTRALTSQLADDLGWLEQHTRLLPEQARAASQLRLAAALVRNCIGPFLDGQPAAPLHIVVLGGAGAGKSTIVNFLLGTPAAEANPQAGFTRHPIAYTSYSGPLSWASHLNFLGPLTRLQAPGPSNIDEDVYQVRRVPSDPSTYDLLKNFVVWDCPDVTTWAAQNYIPRLLEVAALSDVLVYVASDERYNDEIPTQFLRLILSTGKPVVVCLVKMREADAGAIVAHFQKEVLGAMPADLARGVVGVVPIPFLSREALADPARHGGKYRIQLFNQVAVLSNPPEVARKRTVSGASHFLVRTQEQLLAGARQDVLALQGWQALVQAGQAEFDQRYAREYLTSEKFRGFDDAMVRLIDLLELPGVGKVISVPLYILRTPYRLAREWVLKTFSRPEGLGRAEQPILEEALNGWLDMLRKESVRRAGEHPLWAHIAEGFQSGALPQGVREKFNQSFRSFQAGLAAEVDRTAKAVYEELAKKPVLLNGLRGGKLALDVAAIGGTLTAGIGWHDVILVPLVASLTHQMVELGGRQIVDAHRELTRRRQQVLMHDHLSGPLAAWLTQWPATGGSSFERLQLALRRIPENVALVEANVRAALNRAE